MGGRSAPQHESNEPPHGGAGSREPGKTSRGARRRGNYIGSGSKTLALKINLGSTEKIIQGARKSRLNFEGSREPRHPPCRG